MPLLCHTVRADSIEINGMTVNLPVNMRLHFIFQIQSPEWGQILNTAAAAAYKMIMRGSVSIKMILAVTKGQLSRLT